MRDPEKQTRLEVLTRHAGRLQSLLAKADASDQIFFLLRLGVLLVGGLLTLLAVFIIPGPSGPAVLAASILAFAGVVYFHRRVDRQRRRLRFSLEVVFSQIARMELDWDRIPLPDVPLAEPDHPFAPDLNISGPVSLHHLIDTTTSNGGSLRLRDWLLESTPDLEKTFARQEVLREMLPLTLFRLRLALKGLLVREAAQGQWQAEGLLRWLRESAPAGSLLPVLIVLFSLAGVNLVLFIMNLAGLLPPFWSISLALYAGIYLYKFRDYNHLVEDAYKVGQTLDQLREILVYLERYPYPKGSRLEVLVQPFIGKEERPSTFLRKIVWILSAASLGENQFLALFFNSLVPWNMMFAYRMSVYKKALESSLGAWLDAWYELEALNSIANFAYLNPAYTFPKITAGQLPGEQYVFEANALGHPLIHDEARVDNDFSFENLGEVVLVTGSNMSGKSTFLRTLGVNLCLANAGAPVAAARLNTSAFRLFTCIQVSDSLSSGISYFYAEVRRLKDLLKALEVESPFPLFFLIDEIFRGTNNRERRIGSQAYVRALVNAQGVGVISTHDLELAKLAEETSSISNYHFREDVVDGRMVFDYRLRYGPSPTSNALRIMALEGLPMPAEGTTEI